jgi:hypothetical protein
MAEVGFRPDAIDNVAQRAQSEAAHVRRLASRSGQLRWQVGSVGGGWDAQNELANAERRLASIAVELDGLAGDLQVRVWWVRIADRLPELPFAIANALVAGLARLFMRTPPPMGPSSDVLGATTKRSAARVDGLVSQAGVVAGRGWTDCVDYVAAVMTAVGLKGAGRAWGSIYSRHDWEANGFRTVATWNRAGGLTNSPPRGSFLEIGSDAPRGTAAADEPHHSAIYLGYSDGHVYLAHANYAPANSGGIVRYPGKGSQGDLIEATQMPSHWDADTNAMPLLNSFLAGAVDSRRHQWNEAFFYQPLEWTLVEPGLSDMNTPAARPSAQLRPDNVKR